MEFFDPQAVYDVAASPLTFTLLALFGAFTLVKGVAKKFIFSPIGAVFGAIAKVFSINTQYVFHGIAATSLVAGMGMAGYGFGTLPRDRHEDLMQISQSGGEESILQRYDTNNSYHEVSSLPPGAGYGTGWGGIGLAAVGVLLGVGTARSPQVPPHRRSLNT